MDVVASSTSVPHDPDDVHPHHARRWIILAFLGLAQLMVVLDATIVNIAMPHAQQSLHFSNVDRQWLVTAYSLAFGSILLLGGRLSDVLGRKTALQIGLLGFAVASAIGGASVDFGMLVLARAIQGLFGGILAPAALAMLTSTFTDPNERGKAFGIYGAIAGAGAAVGLLLGGVLTQYLTWRWTLFVNLIFAGITIVGTQALLVRGRAVARGGIDLVSTLLISSGLFCIVYSLSDAANDAVNAFTAGRPVTLGGAFSGTSTILFLCVGVLLTAGFFAYQARIEHPMLPLSVLADRARAGALLGILIAAAAMFAVFIFLTYFLQQTEHYSPLGTGLAFLPMVGALSVTAASVSTKVLPRTGPRLLMSVGMCAGGLGLYLFTHLAPGSSYAGTVLPGLLVTGAGMGLVFATAMNTATARLHPDEAGVASAMVNVTQQVGGSIGTALLSAVWISSEVAALTGGTAVRQATVHGYVSAFWWGVWLFAAGAVVSVLVLPRGRPQLAPAVGTEPATGHPAPA